MAPPPTITHCASLRMHHLPVIHLASLLSAGRRRYTRPGPRVGSCFRTGLRLSSMTISDYRSALVTGASAGIGEAVVTDLCARGLTVHAVARSEDRLEALADATGCTNHVLDVRDTTAMEDLFGSLGVDVLVNNAGVVGQSSRFPMQTRPISTRQSPPT